jgi:inner membrane protein involved in colicin E2 resistance
MKRLVAIGVIWAACAVSWGVLGGAIVHRSGESEYALDQEVRALWGTPMVQRPPTAAHVQTRTVTKSREVQGDDGTWRTEATRTEVSEEVPWALMASSVEADLNLDHRRKGLLWFPTYEVAFQGRYTFHRESSEERELKVRFPIEAPDITDLRVTDAAGAEVDVVVEAGNVTWTHAVRPGERPTWTIAFRTRGLRSWGYAPGTVKDELAQVEKLDVVIRTDTADIDFPAGTLSPTRHGATDAGWQGRWAFHRLVTSSEIGVELPQRLNPGPLAARITFFAPVALLFFFFVVAMLAVVSRQALHPMHYFFLGCSFFAFHLLFAYLVDHVALGLSFAISSLVSMALVVSYVRLFRGWHFALWKVGLPQLLYLVLFSFTFFFEGMTGLSISIGAVLTLFVIMQLTGRLDWDEVWSATGGAPPRRADV